MNTVSRGKMLKVKGVCVLLNKEADRTISQSSLEFTLVSNLHVHKGCN